MPISDNPDKGLLRAIIAMMNGSGPARTYQWEQITETLKSQGQWAYRDPRTPGQSVKATLSENTPRIFERVIRGWYRLQLAYVAVAETPEAPDAFRTEEADAKQPDRAVQTTYRILRDTEMARRLKALHSNRCQICGESMCLPQGPYSEAHHIQPLGTPHNGPDVPENILVLCPNHHVMCDYGALPLTADMVTPAPHHKIAQVYLDYHNVKMFTGTKGE